MKDGKEILRKAGIKDYDIEAEVLLSNVLDLKRYRLYIEKINISRTHFKKYFLLLQKRIRGIPLVYLIKYVYFWKYRFEMEPGVFIPRPETELIIESAKQIFSEKDKIKILDICTGCGVLAVCLAKEFPESKVVATDISGKSICLSKKNAKNIDVSDRIEFLRCNLFPRKKIFYDLIISNPPYISKSAMRNLPKEVQYEPERALDGGKNGLDYHKKIIEGSKKFLKKNGYLIMEISPEQKSFFLDRNFSSLKVMEIKKDFCNLDRVVILSDL